MHGDPFLYPAAIAAYMRGNLITSALTASPATTRR